MKKTIHFTNQVCPLCGEYLLFIPHVEFDYEDGSFEPDFECPNNCDLSEVVDTETEFGLINTKYIKGVSIA